MEFFQPVLPIFGALGAGFIVGKLGGRSLRAMAGKCIVPSVLVLMLLVGAEAGSVLLTLSSLGSTLALAMVIATFTTISSVTPFFFLFRPAFHALRDGVAAGNRKWLAKLALDCSIPIAMVAIGAVISGMPVLEARTAFAADATYIFLLVLIFLVGVDLCTATFHRDAFTKRIFALPLIVIAGSMIGGTAAAVIMNEPIRVVLGLVSGFGWFSMSGALVSNLAGPFYGTIAMLTDLFRELMAMTLLYAFGRCSPLVGIAGGGAASMDSLLPVIRVTCHHSVIPLSIISGVVLTIIGPIMISMFLSDIPHFK